MLGQCCWLKFDHFQTWANNTQHVATRWPNAHNMLRPTMLRSLGRGLRRQLLLTWQSLMADYNMASKMYLASKKLENEPSTILARNYTTFKFKSRGFRPRNRCRSNSSVSSGAAGSDAGTRKWSTLGKNEGKELLIIQVQFYLFLNLHYLRMVIVELYALYAPPKNQKLRKSDLKYRYTRLS